MPAIAIALAELVKFAAMNGEDIAKLVSDFCCARPDLVGLDVPAPDLEPARADIDSELDRLIERGKL